MSSVLYMYWLPPNTHHSSHHVEVHGPSAYETETFRAMADGGATAGRLSNFLAAPCHPRLRIAPYDLSSKKLQPSKRYLYLHIYFQLYLCPCLCLYLHYHLYLHSGSPCLAVPRRPAHRAVEGRGHRQPRSSGRGVQEAVLAGFHRSSKYYRDLNNYRYHGYITFRV